jgi:hypothetical protein
MMPALLLPWLLLAMLLLVLLMGPLPRAGHPVRLRRQFLPLLLSRRISRRNAHPWRLRARLLFLLLLLPLWLLRCRLLRGRATGCGSMSRLPAAGTGRTLLGLSQPWSRHCSRHQLSWREI